MATLGSSSPCTRALRPAYHKPRLRKVSSCVNRSRRGEGMPFYNVRWFNFDDRALPEWPGVYGITNSAKEVIYIGQTDNLKRRIDEHKNDTRHCMHRRGPLRIVFEYVSDEKLRLARERQLIDEYRPPCNKQ